MPRLDHRATFLRSVQAADEDGGIVQGWQSATEAWAGVRYLRGGETVMQARLASKSPAILTVQSNPSTQQVTSEWRVTVEGRSGTARTFEIKEDPRPTPEGGWLEMLVEAVG